MIGAAATRWAVGAAALALVAATPGSPCAQPRAQADLGCTLHHEVEVLDGFSALPVDVQAALKAKVGTLAMPGEPYDSGDVRFPGEVARPHHRFARALHAGRRWIVWYEHGGYGVHKHVVAFVELVSGNPPVPAPPAVASHLVGNYCAATDAILDGVSPAAPGDW